jgi:hypothetical protein
MMKAFPAASRAKLAADSMRRNRDAQKSLDVSAMCSYHVLTIFGIVDKTNTHLDLD